MLSWVSDAHPSKPETTKSWSRVYKRHSWSPKNTSRYLPKKQIASWTVTKSFRVKIKISIARILETRFSYPKATRKPLCHRKKKTQKLLIHPWSKSKAFLHQIIKKRQQPIEMIQTRLLLPCSHMICTLMLMWTQRKVMGLKNKKWLVEARSWRDPKIAPLTSSKSSSTSLLDAPTCSIDWMDLIRLMGSEFCKRSNLSLKMLTSCNCAELRILRRGTRSSNESKMFS